VKPCASSPCSCRRPRASAAWRSAARPRKPSTVGGGGLLVGSRSAISRTPRTRASGWSPTSSSPRGRTPRDPLQTGASSTAAGRSTRRCRGRAGWSPRSSTPTTAPERRHRPQVMPARAVRPYAYALAGLGYFATDTSLGDGYDDYYGDHTTTNYDDTTFAWSAGAGLLFPVSGASPSTWDPVRGNGTVRYLAEGDCNPRRPAPRRHRPAHDGGQSGHHHDRGERRLLSRSALCPLRCTAPGLRTFSLDSRGRAATLLVYQ